jgi:hypothetical protein
MNALILLKITFPPPIKAGNISAHTTIPNMAWVEARNVIHFRGHWDGNSSAVIPSVIGDSIPIQELDGPSLRAITTLKTGEIGSGINPPVVRY